MSELSQALLRNDPGEPPRLALRASEAAGVLGISRAQFFKLHAQGRIPLPRQLGTRAPRWDFDELRAWLAADCPDRQRWEQMKSR